LLAVSRLCLWSTPIRALAILHWTGAEMNEARLRMTRIPKGADLILNKVLGRLASGSAMQS
jgi:hypothetical protein